MKAHTSLQERFLAELCRDKTFIRIFLTSGIRLEGYIKSFDQYVLYMEEPTPQIIYKSAICSIVVGQPKYSTPNKNTADDKGMPTYESVEELFKKRGLPHRRAY